jgi:hypothetical protein
MDKDMLGFFVAIGTCHRLLEEFAQRLRLNLSVTGVTHWMNAQDIDNSCRIEEFVDAELTNGEARSWRLELLVSPDKFVIESDVRRIHSDGQDCIAEVAEQVHLTVTECTAGILEVVKNLSSRCPV